MKVQVLFKTPDVQYDALEELRRDRVDGGTDESSEAFCERVEALMRKFIQFGEFLRVEFDVDKGTATVLEVL